MSFIRFDRTGRWRGRLLALAVVLVAATGYTADRPGVAGLDPHTRIGKYTVVEWQDEIDAFWGEGADTAEKLQVFDEAWRELDEGYGAYMNLEVDMQALRSRYRPEIEAGVSRGRFAAIMNHLSLAMMDAHTFILNGPVNWQTSLFYDPPLFVIGGWSNNARFGASLTPMPDGSLLVFRVRHNHPLGLELGDLVLGYDGEPWRELYPQLLAAELPIMLQSSFGSTEQSMEHAMLISLGHNWHLFDSIDIQKYGTDEVISRPTELLASLYVPVWGNEQLPVAGVEMPDFIDQDYITWGMVDGTRIGYIYVASWHWEDQYQISEQWYEALDQLMHHHETEGLIVDFRLNYGGYMLEAHDGYRLLFNETIREFAFDVRGSPDDHLDMVPHPSFTRFLFTIAGDPTTFYDKPLAVLIGPGALSNGDWESLRMGYHPMVRRFGLPTNGAFTSSDFPDLGDEWYFTRATGSGYLFTGHHYLAHTGVQPDVEVWLRRDDVAAGRDTVVEEAKRWIEAAGEPPRRVNGRVLP